MNILQKYGMIAVLVILLGVGSASALTQEQITVTSNLDWVTAGSADSANITVRVNSEYSSIVRIWCADPALGRITSGAEQYIEADEVGSAVFTPGTQSGEAVIRVNVTVEETRESNETYLIQKVDHALPKYYSGMEFVPEVTVGNTTLITVQLKDMYGNPVEIQRQVDYSEMITFLASPDDDGGFWNGTAYVERISVPVNGSASILYQTPTRAGKNVIQVVAPITVVNNIRWITVTGIPDVPVRLSATITSRLDTNSSAPHEAEANGRDIFSLYYTVYDRYNNPIPGMSVTWKLYSQGRLSDTRFYTTNYQGQLYLAHGPSTVIQDFTATAELSANETIFCSDTLSYINGGPSIFVIYTNPEVIASREIDPNSTSTIRARLMDGLGRPLAGEVIQFDIVSDVGSGSPLDLNASFNPDDWQRNAESTTDGSGYAMVPYYPGAFPSFEDEDAWNPDSYGTTVITATSADLGTRTLTVTYKNYPYLRAETELQPPLVAVNDSVNIAIRLIGDGFVQYKPIDVVLCNNRGEAMLKDMYWDRDRGRMEDKMVYLYEATQNFTYNLQGGSNYIGLVSFGINGSVNIPHAANSTYSLPGVDNDASDDQSYTDAHYFHPKTYDDYATIDSNLTKNLSFIISILNQTAPSKDPQGTVLVPMRYGLYKSINTLNASGHAGHVRGIILLTDSEWTAYGDPTAGWDGSGTTSNQGYYPAERDPVELSQGGKGLWTAFAPWAKTDVRQDMAHYANENDIHIYTIAYFKKGTTVPVSLDRILLYLSSSTGGKYYIADSAKALDEIYVDIAEDLKKYASVDTAMNLSFERMNVTYDNTTESLPGGQVFSYQYEQYVSTNVTKWNKTVNPLPNNLPVPPYPAIAIPAPHNDRGTLVINYPYSLNQTAQWNSSGLDLYAGNIMLGETWQAKFRLKALTAGFIDLFGENSAICYSNEENPRTCIPMPATYLTVISNHTGDPTAQAAIDIIDGSIAVTSGGSGNLATVSWALNYTGQSTVLQDAYYQFSADGSFWDNNWIHFGSVRSSAGPLDHHTFGTELDTREITGCVKIRIFAFEEITPAGASDEEISGIACPARPPSIKIT
ncbi:MAG: hypothetical protein LUO93_07285 [Methanomicrobiales archaeon]|nr:hypothetical protein [Methanomicrobiales archaeon]